jgi:copper transporter 1
MIHSGDDMMASTTAMTMSAMSGMMQTATGTAAMASSTGMSMGGGMGMGGGCKISV